MVDISGYISVKNDLRQTSYLSFINNFASWGTLSPKFVSEDQASMIRALSLRA